MKGTARVPEVVIIGPPKTGTSSLYAWLDSHPQVEGSRPKETWFLMDEGHPLSLRAGGYHEVGLRGYDRFFSGEEDRIRLEATTHYCYQDTALDVLTRDPDRIPLIISVLRNPADRVYSHFRYMQESQGVLSREVTFDEFARVLIIGDLRPLRSAFRSRASRFVASRLLMMSSYALWLERWSRSIPEDRLLVIRFEEVTGAPHSVLATIAEKLGIDAAPFEEVDTAPRNPTISVRNAGLHRVARRFAPIVRRGRLPFLTALYRKAQTKDSPKSDRRRDDAGIARLTEYFKPLNEALTTRHGIRTDDWNS